jgi:hypothetical protein
MAKLAAATRKLLGKIVDFATDTPFANNGRVLMSLLEKDAYIDYPRIEANINIVRERRARKTQSLLNSEESTG